MSLSNTDIEYIRNTRLSLEGSDSPLALKDDFEPTLFKWIVGGDGAGTASRNTTIARDGLASMLLATDVNEDDEAFARRFFGNPNIGPNFQCRFDYFVDNPIAEFWDLRASVIFNDLANQQEFRFETRVATSAEWYIYTEPATYVDLNLGIPAYSDTVEYWHQVEFGGNIDNIVWQFARINNQRVNILGFNNGQNYQPNIEVGGLFFTQLEFRAFNRNTSGNAVNIYIDNVELSFRGN